MIKEDGLLPYNNWFHARGMNFAIMDGPGQGECNINQVWVDHHNYARAGSRVIDWLAERDEVDSSKIGIMGMSMGSRWTVEIAAQDDRVKAVVGQMANVGPSDIIFDQAQPNFKRIYMYMTNILDEDAFDEFVEERDSIWLPLVGKMKSNYLPRGGRHGRALHAGRHRRVLRATSPARVSSGSTRAYSTPWARSRRTCIPPSRTGCCTRWRAACRRTTTSG